MVRPSPFRKFTTAFGSTCISSWFYSKNYRLSFSCISYVPWLFSCLFLFLSYGITEWFVSQCILSFSLSVSPLELFCFPDSSHWSNFPIPDFFTQLACFPHSSHWSIFPILNFFTQPATHKWENFPTAQKSCINGLFWLTFCVIITTAINQIHKTSIKSSENMLDKPVLHVYFIYEHIFICFHVWE